MGLANEHAISTSCIGLGEDYEERLLTAMAEAGAGNLVHLTAPHQLEAVFAAELKGLNLAQAGICGCGSAQARVST